MDDERSLFNETEPHADAAAEAFAGLAERVAAMEERLEGRMAMMTRALEHIAIEKQSIEIPDYTPTLAKMNSHLVSLVSEAKAIRESPAQQLTPGSMASEIAEAARTAREPDRATINRSADLHRHIHADIKNVVGTIRTKDQQRWQMLYCGAGTALVISLLWLIYPGWVASIAPRSWLWPEAVARRTLGEPTLWDAGAGLMRAGNPEGWQAIVYAVEVLQTNRGTLDACQQAAAKAKEPVRCTIQIDNPKP